MIGDRLGHYEILAEIGRGGMGQVFRARDSKLGREVALKLLRPDLACDTACRERFKQEARSVAALNHPNIVTVYAVEEAGEHHFLAMELVAGESLRARIRPGGMALAEVLELALPVCDALGAAHAKGIIHCDLKPGNIMVDERGQVKVLDFGLARAVTPSCAEAEPDATVASRSTITLDIMDSSLVAGTLPYMSPEQLGASTLGPASDIFSLGVLLFEMVTGELPFTGSTQALVAAAILNKEMPALAERGGAAAALAPIIRRCLEKDPARRFPAAGELREALANLESAAASSPLEEARAAFVRQAWRQAHDLFCEADGIDGLTGDDLERYGETAFWLGEIDETARLFERAFTRHAGDGNRARAGFAAVFRAELAYDRLTSAVARGWLKRAERMLTDLQDTPENGYLLRFQAVLAIEAAKDYRKALDLAGRVMELGRNHGDRDLEALGMQDRGRSLVALGQTSEGMALLDEVMASALGGELSPLIVGRSYCNMISSCHALADYRRAGEWSESGVDWCGAHSESMFPGLCRVYRAEVMRLRGAWAEAEAEVRQVCGQMGMHEITAAAFYEIGEIRLRVGDEVGAEEAFRQAHQLGRDPMPGLAALRLLQGRTDAARDLLERSLADASLAALDRIRLLPLQVEIAITVGDLAAARTALAELDELTQPFQSPVFKATCEQTRGMLLLADDRVGEAVSALERGLRLWTDADLPYESAKTRVLLAKAYLRARNPESAELEAAAARTTFRRLGAELDLRAAEKLPGGTDAAAP